MKYAHKYLIPIAIFLSQSFGKEIRLFINGTVPVYTVDPKSPSVTIEVAIFEYGWAQYLNNAKLLTLAKALGPSYVRMGGTKSDHAFFIPDDHQRKKKIRQADICMGRIPNKLEFDRHREKAYRKLQLFNEKKSFHGLKNLEFNISYTAKQFDEFMTFVNCAQWNLVFGLNLLSRKENEWNPTNSIQLLQHAKQEKYQIDWELGNEPNSYRHKAGIYLSPKEVAKGFHELNNILKEDEWWRNYKLIGPDANGMFKTTSRKFLKKFLLEVGGIMNAVTFHQYYIDSRIATMDNFTDPTILNKLLRQVKDVARIVRQQAGQASVWLGETSSSFGGGAKGLSDTYVAGFMWLDKLGMCARNGVDVVCRQTLFQGNYALLNDNFDPRPDYWLTLLYKRLVGPRVLNVTTREVAADSINSEGGRVRMYAHCTNTDRTHYPAGSVTVYFLNLSNRNKSLDIVHPSELQADVFILTSSPNALNSSDVFLNGVKLQMIDDYTLPNLNPRTIPFSDIKLPSMSFGFIVLQTMRMVACM